MDLTQRSYLPIDDFFWPVTVDVGPNKVLPQPVVEMIGANQSQSKSHSSLRHIYAFEIHHVHIYEY